MNGKLEIGVEPDLRAFPGKLESGMRGMAGVAGRIGKGIGLAITAGTAVAAVGLGQVIDKGVEYQANLNELQAVSTATASEMRRVGEVAKDLGSDMTLPATSAADAAAGMVELAKGGLSVAEAMTAAKGTLQLAAAAQVDAATAAEIQSSSLNAFGLAATQATRVADVLANTSNAAAGSIVDVGNSLKYVAPVAAALKISLEDTASAIGLLANQGIKGEQAGTSLRGILASLSSPSLAARKALRALNVEVFDASGKFVGLRKFTEQLAAAKRKLTDAEFAAAASTAFGNEGLTAANALAAEGTKGFDEMAKAVSKQGGAAEVAAAKTKGLGGAIEGFKSQVETASIGIFEAIDGPLERAARSGASFVERMTPGVVRGLETAVAVGEQFGPKLVAAVGSRLRDLREQGSKLLSPLAEGIRDAVNSGINLGTTAVRGFVDVVDHGVDAVQPLVRGVGDLAASFDKAGGPVGALRVGLELTYDIATGIVTVIAPAVEVVGGLISAFADLPGPIQTAALALLALKVGPTILTGLRSVFTGARDEADGARRSTGLLGRSLSTVLAPARLVVSGVGSVVTTVRQFNDEARVQQALSRGAGAEVGRLGGAMAAYNTTTLSGVAAMRGWTTQVGEVRRGAAGANAPVGVLAAAFGALAERSPAIGASAASFARVSTAVQAAGERAGLAAGIAVESFGRAIPTAVGKTLSAVAQIPSRVAAAGSALHSGVELVADRTATALTRLGQLASDLPARIAGGFGSMRDAVASRAQSVVQSVQAIPTAIGVAAINTVDKAKAIGTGIGGAFSAAAERVRLLPTAIGVGLISALERVPGAVQGTVSAIGTLASKAAGAATSLGTLAVRGATGLVGALGGPFGLAIAGASIGLGILASNQEKAAAAAQRHRQGVDGLASALKDTGGVINNQIRGQIANTLVTEFSRGADAAKRFGVSLDQVVDIAVRGGDVSKDLVDRLRSAIEADPLSDEAQAAMALIGTLNELHSRVGGAVEQHKRLAEATGGASESSLGLSRAVGTLASSTSTANDKASALRETLRLLTGGAQDARDAQASFYQAIDGLAERIANAKGEILDNNKALNVTSERGRLVNDVLKQSQQAFTDYAASQQAAGKSSAEISTGLQTMRNDLEAFLVSIGLAPEVAKNLADAANLIPTDIAIAVTSPGMVSATKAAELLAGKVSSIPDDKTVKVTSLTDEAEKSLKELGFKIERLEDGTVTVTADDATAMAQLQNLLHVISTSTGTAKIAGDPRPAYDEHGKLIRFIDGSKGTVTADADLAPAYNSAGQFLGFVNRSYATTTGRANFQPAYDATHNIIGFIDSRVGTLKVGANTTPAQDAVDGFIRRNDGRQIKIGLAAVQSGIASHDGNLIKAFAQGGYHLGDKKLRPMPAGFAQIVAPNTWRVVGDRLRDDEAYIPINRSTRSQHLLGETARRMGYALVRRFAEGGLASAGSNASVSILDGPMRIVGRLDLGDGLVGVVDGRIEAAERRTGNAISRGTR